MLWKPKKFFLFQKIFRHKKIFPHYKFWRTQKLSKKRSLSPYSRKIEFFRKPHRRTRRKISNGIVLKSLDMLSAAQKQKTGEMLNKIEDSDVIDFIDNAELTVNKNSSKIALSTFPYNLQQPNKTLSAPAYSRVLKELQLYPGSVQNENAKGILKPLPETAKKTCNERSVLSYLLRSQRQKNWRIK